MDGKGAIGGAPGAGRFRGLGDDITLGERLLDELGPTTRYPDCQQRSARCRKRTALPKK